ncbi:chloride channel [Blyttiomyces helicus]|uniref:Chloride channel protein n=1 Tax=Blyttiomyces helicus TaxID=388810 RepID=A0A4P9W5J8_9FUNG|nr:chloride channel [Blyttiomyces helicus]|eukprot:RKO87232.1 chloride channel [Blyttiomyces helicus]
MNHSASKIKCVGLVLTVGSGLSLGKEGPLVHVACCVGNIFPRIFDKYARNEAKKREILSASSAAGVSVAFGAPIGGVLFSLEEVSYYFPYKTMWRSFFCAMVAAISLQLMNPFRTGKLVLFQVEYKRDWHGFELPFFILLGVLGGLYGSFFIHMNIRIAAFRKSTWLKNYGVAEVLVVTLVTALLSFTVMFTRVSAGELVANLFRECEEVEEDFHGLCKSPSMGSVIALLLFSAFLKIVLTIFTFGIRIPAGIFVPSMAIGACVGRALGIAMQLWQEAYPTLWLFSSCKTGQQCVTPGTYAMVGAAAALAGVTRMTVSLTVIMFELTGALSYVLPIMITVMVAKWVGDAFGLEGIYDALIHLNGYPFLDTKEEYSFNATAAQIMTRSEDLEVITATGHTLGSLDELVQNTDVKGYPVVTSYQDMHMVGYAGRAELRYAIDRARNRDGVADSTPCYLSEDLPLLDSAMFVDFRPWTDQTPMTISPRFPMEMVMELFKKMGLRYVLVTRDGQVLGIITKKDLLRHGRDLLRTMEGRL